ncbi:MAG: hypothetical protein ABIR91_03390 [Candidatus Saccharimonadales bacterium]
MCNLPFKQKLVELESQLGKTLVAVLANDRRRDIVPDWIAGVETVPPESMQRIEFAHEMFGVVTKTEGSDIARLWFCGDNVTGGGELISPIEAISIGESRFDDVKISAQRLERDEWI